MCSALIAKSLDRLNVTAVAWRLRQDSGFVSPTGPDAGRSDEVTSPAEPPRPLRRRGGEEIWGAAGSNWLAGRVPSRSVGSADRAVIFLHGWLATRVQLGYYRWLARPLTRTGEVWFPRLPAHVERTPRGAVSGSRSLTADTQHTARVIRQAVAETRWLAGWLRETGRPVSLWGISLGGWVAALAAAEPICDRLVLWEPVVDPVETVSWSPLGRVVAERAAAEADDRELAATLGDLAPRGRELALSGDRILVVGGVHDNVVRHATLAATARAWGAHMESLEHGHISLLLSPRARRLTIASLDS